MSEILINVNDQSLTFMDSPKIAAQGVNENYVVFTFSSDWDGFGKTAFFYYEDNEDEVYTSIVNASDKAVIPWEVTEKSGKINIGVYGVKDDVIHTSEILRYKVVDGLYTEGSQSEPPTPGIYEQILSLIGDVQGDVARRVQVETDARLLAEQELSTQISSNTSRINGIVTAFATEGSETTLYTGQARYTGTVYTIAEAVTGFDYLDVYTNFYGVKAIQRIPAEENSTFDINGFNLSDYSGGTGHPIIEGGEIKISFSDTIMTVENHSYYRYNKDTSGDPIAGNLASSATDAIKALAGWIYKVVGHKVSENTELVDARVGYDGTEYDSVGDAIRGQAQKATLLTNGNILLDIGGES